MRAAMRCAGCDCLGSIHYFDALMANSKGALHICHILHHLCVQGNGRHTLACRSLGNEGRH